MGRLLHPRGQAPTFVPIFSRIIGEDKNHQNYCNFKFRPTFGVRPSMIIIDKSGRSRDCVNKTEVNHCKFKNINKKFKT